ncbi:hypothetical protein LG200_05150 [Methylobacillus caricis]|uniref:hypothetical protein n=1 Tax=Methylobacillus caricis TaxID=1971611 RepID=UPI001CFF7EE5|nr:hypothetical protein [Methylobacillus caricis]MCB5187391.1 hypothetical protein [Methylobacillus caricis]
MNYAITKILAVFALLLLGCLAYVQYGYHLDGDIRATMNKIRHNAKDPDSIQFRSLRKVKARIAEADIKTICGEYNGKNSFGAYVGFTPFYALVLTDNPIIYDAEHDVQNYHLYCSTSL